MDEHRLEQIITCEQNRSGTPPPQKHVVFSELYISDSHMVTV